MLTVFFIIAVTGGVIYYTVDIRAFHYLLNIRLSALIGATVLSLAGIWLDAHRFTIMTQLTKDTLSQKQAMKILFANYFLALFTPGATGGPVAQLLLLRRYGISTGRSTIFVLTRTLLSITIMVLLMPLIFYTEASFPDTIPYYLPLALFLGLVVGILTLFFLIRSKRFLRWSRGIISIWASGNLRKKMLRLHGELTGVAYLFSKNPFKLLHLLGLTAASLITSYSLVPLLFWGIGFPTNWLEALGRMFLLNFFMHFAPTPGGSGIAEGLFILLFTDPIPQSIAGIIALIWRILAEYLPFTLGLIAIVQEFGYGYLKEKFWPTPPKG